MFISRLEMQGFKSFASRTLMEFRPGVMAVVGPNGCGKTNIVDAVRWVLGEQRTSSLRAERMESVIFNGTDRRKPLGMAEVTLTVENNRGLLPENYSELSVTRRLFRSGESEYLINRQPARLRDFHDLFAGTGLSVGTYSIIELAMVEEIISGSAASRRQLFEEAAGVSKYKARRLATERRLQTLKDDLARLNDLLAEVEKNFHSLQRQAAKARRWQQISKAVSQRLALELAEQRLDILTHQKPLEERLAALADEAAAAEAAAVQATSELLTLEGRELTAIDRINRIQEALKRLDRREAELAGETSLVKSRLGRLQEDLTALSQRRQTLEIRLDTLQTQRAEVQSESVSLERELEAVEARRQDLTAEVRRAEPELREAELRVNQLRTAESQAAAKLESLAEQRRRSSEQRIRLEERRRALEAEIEALNASLEGLARQRREAEAEHSRLRAQFEDLNTRLAALEQEVAGAKESRRAAESRRAEAAAELEAARAALKVHLRLQETTPRYAALGTTLAERLECAPEFRAALAVCLGAVLDACDVNDLSDALKIFDSLPSTRLVLRTQAPLPSALPEAPLPVNATGCRLGSSLVTGDDEAAGFVRRRLADVVVVPSCADLLRLKDWANRHNVRLVTLSGELLEPDGVFYAPAEDPEARRIGWLKLKSELEQAATVAQERLSAAESDLAACTKAADAAEREYAHTRRELQDIEQRLNLLTLRLSALDEDLARTHSRLDGLRTERDRLPVEENTIGPGGGEGVTDLWERELDNARRLRTEAEAKWRDASRRLTEANSTLAQQVAVAAGLEERLRFARREIERLERETEAARAELAALDARRTNLEAELKRTREAADNLAAQTQMHEREKSGLAADLESARRQRSEIRTAREATNQKLTSNQARQKSILEERVGLESELASLRERLREVDRRLAEDAGVPPSSVDESTIQDITAALADAGLADVPLEKLRIRLQSLGPVNMVALEELPETESRYRFLSDQRQDLQNGIQALEETIDRINVEARRIFRETFDRINYHFQETFHALFEGGEAQLSLADGDPLEADIRIWATPSGKKLQSLSMLSGGEKAMTAVALLFSMYRARPTPFCILDEVDAPLDDANVTRFNRLLRQHSDQTQFLVVTHNKRTMEMADCLFGVTLGEDGTSQLVSVKLERAGQPAGAEGGAVA